MMMVGANLSSRAALADLEQLLARGQIDFVEVLLDNWIGLDPARSLSEWQGRFGDLPVAFHLMNSRFLERDTSELRTLAREVRGWIEVFRPLYVSDHLARFEYQGRRLTGLLEWNYARDFEPARTRVDAWQDALGSRLWIENFASFQALDALDYGQPEFFTALCGATGSGVLFDVSNALIAEQHGVTPLTRWRAVAPWLLHLHAGGYRETAIGWIDSHDRRLSSATIRALAAVLGDWRVPARTLSVERDAEWSTEEWSSDLASVRAVATTGPSARELGICAPDLGSPR